MKIELIVMKKVYHVNGYGIYACKPCNGYESKVELHKIYRNFTIKGNVPELVENEKYEFELGEIERSSKGNAYPIESFKIKTESSSASQYLFLKSILTEKQYEKICAFYPPYEKIKIIDQIKENKIDLSSIKGIGQKVSQTIIKKIRENEEKILLINKLSPLGVSELVINSIIKHYGSVLEAINKISKSFYNLCEVKGLGFEKVDSYALKNGEKLDSLKRAEACLNYHIHNLASEGHSWTEISEMKKLLLKSLKIESDKILELIEKLKKEKDTEVLFKDNRVTSKTYYNQEVSILENLKRINENFKSEINQENLDSYIKIAENKLKITYTEEQRETIIESLSHGVYKINGKGGTGKSQIIKGITTICEETGKSYKAIALSGRAAQLLTLKEIDSSTIHRALGYKGEGFVFNEYDPMPYDVVILEESSMVNAYLWNSILKAIKSGSQFIIVGDSGQLSGIGNGDVLRDLLSNNLFKGQELLKIHRQAQGSGIIEIAGLIREGRNFIDFIHQSDFNYESKELFNHYGENEDLTLITYKDKENIFGSAYQIIKQKLSTIKESKEESIMDFQILVSNKSRGQISALEINNYCQKILELPNKNKVSNSRYTFLKGDKVIVSGNKYKIKMYESEKDYLFGNPIKKEIELEDGSKDYVIQEFSLFNGTMGIVESLKEIKNEESLLIKFEGFYGYIAIEKEDLNSIDLAYAITIHRSQGMSIPNVLVLIDYSAYKLLSRQLIYTAITRASKKCVLLAEHNALYSGIQNDASGHRRTFLQDLMKSN